MPSLLSPMPQTPHTQSRRQSHETSSPSYFGLSLEPSRSSVVSSASRNLHIPYSPGATTSIRSVAASPPQNLPLHSNPEYEAFKKQSEARNTFSLSGGSVSQFTVPTLHRTSSSRPNLVSRTSSRNSPIVGTPRGGQPYPVLAKSDSIGYGEAARQMRSPSKKVLPSDGHPVIIDEALRESPLSLPDLGGSPVKRGDKRGQFPGEGTVSTIPHHHRAETMPDKIDGDTPNLVAPQHIIAVLEAHADDVLILDLRVSTQYGRACIKGALNLCVPTTLLKRPSYNVGRLADTFKDDAQREQFEKWQDCAYIIVYDTNSSQMKDAANCLNVLKKFSNEGWSGNAYIVRGGFTEFSRKHPDWIQQGDEAPASNGPGRPALSLQTGDNKVAPVIGGCPMPATKSAANPFFGNIRQNTDLLDGVGQMEVRYPSQMSEERKDDLPTWLKDAARSADHGKTVSDRFLNIEKREQKRMQEALSGNVTYGTPTPGASRKVQIAGIEKGSKNRYNNIYPFEHSRVKLKDIGKDGCDYVNASYIATSKSKKNYISTQAPIPATFGDFWDMVWQRDIRVIVMLTAEAEGGQVKAHNYWKDGQYSHCRLNFLSEHRASLELDRIMAHRKRPSLGAHRSSKDARRGSTDYTNGSTKSDKSEISTPTSETPYVIVRKFTLANASQPFERMREITQLQYSSWPDFGAPAHPAHLLGLVEQCDAVVQASRAGASITTPLSPRDGPDEEDRPVLVHCSAGCGRTGTFCTVDSVVDMLKAQRKSRDQRRRREASPMDIDPPGWHSMDASKDDNPFFGESLPMGGPKALTPGAAGRDWLARDDIDLIETTVEELRSQRISMVQSLRQFVLCYETVLEWIAHQDSL